MRVQINASEPRRAKLHMEAAWNSIFNSRASAVHKLREFAIHVTRDENGDLITKEVPL